MRWLWRATVAASALTGALVVAAVVLTAIAPTRAAIAFSAVGGSVAIMSGAVGVLLARRVPGNPVGALLAFVGLTVAFTAAREIGWIVLARHPHALASLDWLVAALAESSAWMFVALALFLLYFPDGRLPGRRWRFAVPALLVTGAVDHGYGAVETTPFRPPLEDLERPFGPPPAAIDAVAAVSEVVLLLLLIASAGSLVVRFRRSDELRRRQLKWLAFAGVGVPGFLVVCGSEVLLLGRPWWVSVGVGVAMLLGIPVATAIAILRHDLYDIDRALATAAAYALATIVLVAIYAGAAFTAGLLVGRDSALVAAAATAVAAVALAPLRQGLQRRVDRRLYPLRRAALAAVEDLQRRVHRDGARPEELVERLRVALRDPGLRIGYVRPGVEGLVDREGATVATERAVPVAVGGVVIGALVPTAPPASPELLREVAAASATLVELARLRLELSAALREVEASRARLVQVGDEQRQRVVRDLHDGAQQRLVSLGMTLRVEQRHLDDQRVDVSGLIDQTVAELGTAVAELRQLAHGLRPSALDDGLRPALAALTQQVPIPVELDVRADALPDDVATTVYYVASEAVANVVKHAGASSIAVRVARRNGRIEVRIADDGKGGAAMVPGSGLAGLDDRVGALGGQLTVDSRQGRGTTVEAVMPCGS